jgi:hypothetical protein
VSVRRGRSVGQKVRSDEKVWNGHRPIVAIDPVREQ